MHPHFLCVEPSLQLHHQRLLDDAARHRLARLAHLARPAHPASASRVAAPAPSSLRHQVASLLRSLAAWLDDRTTFDPAAALQALA
jgi:hypothetical protein